MKVVELNIAKENCPMTFVKTKLAIEKLNKGDQIEIILKEGEPLENVPKTLKEQGNEILKIIHLKNDIYKVIVKKG